MARSADGQRKKLPQCSFFFGDTMRLDFVNERYRSETKSLAGIERTHRVRSPLSQTKKPPFREAFINGALGGIRTHNLLIRSQMLYPIELRAHNLCF